MNAVIEKAKHKIESIMLPNHLTSMEYICSLCGDFITIYKKNSKFYEVQQNYVVLDTVEVENA